MCLWNNDYLFVGNDSNLIKLIDIKNKKFIMDLIGHNGTLKTIKKIIHPQYGECLISQSTNDYKIKIWTI